jgi:hypothetical protein
LRERVDFKLSGRLEQRWELHKPPSLTARALRFTGELLAQLSPWPQDRPWLVGRIGRSLPESWFPFVSRFDLSDAYIGPTFFKRLADSLGGAVMPHGAATAGVLERFTDLQDQAHGSFDAAQVAPIVHRFYEQTSAFTMRLTAKPVWFMRPIVHLLVRPYTRRIGQLDIPWDQSHVLLMSHVDLIDLDLDGKADLRVWVRMLPGATAAMQVGAYKAYLSADEPPHMVAVMPLPDGNITAVLLPSNLPDGGMLLSSSDRRSRIAGIYRVKRARRGLHFSPSIVSSETFRMSVTDSDEIKVRAETRVLGVFAFALEYTIAPKPSTPEVVAVAGSAARALRHRTYVK